MSTKVWHILEKSNRDNDADAAKQQRNQMYTGVATLYHEFRPRYPESLIDDAIQESPLLQKDASTCKVLEIGCGPGTLTLPLAKRGFDITTLDPGIGMLNKCKEVCSGYKNVEYIQLPFQDFQSDIQFDTIFAGTSLHWAITGKDQAATIKKLHSLLKDDGKLILFWAYPPEPSDDIRDAVADALGVSKPLYFGGDSQQGHEKSILERVNKPLFDSGCFEFTKTLRVESSPAPSPEDYISFLKTLSPNIIKEKEEAKKYFDTIERVLVEKCGQSVPTTAGSSANIISKLPSMM